MKRLRAPSSIVRFYKKEGRPVDAAAFAIFQHLRLVFRALSALSGGFV